MSLFIYARDRNVLYVVRPGEEVALRNLMSEEPKWRRNGWLWDTHAEAACELVAPEEFTNV